MIQAPPPAVPPMTSQPSNKARPEKDAPNAPPPLMPIKTSAKVTCTVLPGNRLTNCKLVSGGLSNAPSVLRELEGMNPADRKGDFKLRTPSHPHDDRTPPTSADATAAH